jgi:hypothetical protein
MRYVAFYPFMVCADGLPATELTLEALRADGSPTLFADLLLRHATDGGPVLARVQGQPKVVYRLSRTGEPPPLELLAGLPQDAARIAVTASDELGRAKRAEWRAPGVA